MNLTLIQRLPKLMSALFVLGGLVTLFLLFQLQSDLTVHASVLSSGEVEYARPYFLRVQVLTVVTLILGFITVLLLSKSKSSEIVYVEKQKKAESTDENTESLDNTTDIDSSFVDPLINDKTDKKNTVNRIFMACCERIEAVAGAYYELTMVKDEPVFKLVHHFALPLGESQEVSYTIGEGLVGQVAKAGKTMRVNDIPDETVKVISGLGTASPKHLLFIPLLDGKNVIGVTEIGTFKAPADHEVKSIEQAQQKLSDFLKGEKKESKPVISRTEQKSVAPQESGSGKKKKAPADKTDTKQV